MHRIFPACLAALAGILAAPCIQADEGKKNTVTFEAPVQTPVVILHPGVYVFRLMDSAPDRNIVTIWNQDETYLLATVLAIPNRGLESPGQARVSFWDTPDGEPTALRAWFYPGDRFAREFAYPKLKADRLTAETHLQVPRLALEEEASYGGGISRASTTGEPILDKAFSTFSPTATDTNGFVIVGLILTFVGLSAFAVKKGA